MIKPIKENIVDFQELKGFSTATVHEALGQRGALPPSIQPLTASTRLCGRAFTVQARGGSNYFVHKAVYSASRFDVLVIETDCDHVAGYWGELLTRAAQSVRLAGVVLGGHVRDCTEVMALGFPIFSRGACIRGTSKNVAGSLGEPVHFGDTCVKTGDVIVGDADGVVVVGQSVIAQVVARASQRESTESEWKSSTDKGERLIDLIMPKTRPEPPSPSPTTALIL